MRIAASGTDTEHFNHCRNAHRTAINLSDWADFAWVVREALSEEVP